MTTRSLAVVVLLLLLLAAALNAVMDELQFHYDTSVFARFKSQQQWLDPRVSWRNKWKDGDQKQGEKFPLSSTSLVGLTDAWHCAKTLWIDCMLLAIIVPCTRVVRMRWWKWVLVWLGAKVVYGAVFEVFFAWLLRR
jgi:hypothetical protein